MSTSGPKTSRVEELLHIIAERRWTDDEQAEVEAIVSEGRRPFEIEGDWPSERKYDKSTSQDWANADLDNIMPKDARPPLESPASHIGTERPLTDVETRLAQIEAIIKDVLAKQKALEDKLGLAK